MKQIVNNNVKCVHPGHKLKLTIYNKSGTTSSLIMKNYQSSLVDDHQESNLVHEYKCNLGDCEHLNNSYIGVTRTTISRRLTKHKSNGAPKDHLNNHHGAPLTRDNLVNNTNILRLENDQYRLMILEPILIFSKKPSLNGQATGSCRVLKLYSAQEETSLSSTQEGSQLSATSRPSACQKQSPGDPESSDASKYTARAPQKGSRTSGQRVRAPQEDARTSGQRARDHQEDSRTCGRRTRDHKEDSLTSGRRSRDHQEDSHTSGRHARAHQEDSRTSG